MKAAYRTPNGRITVEVQGDEVREIFRQIAAVQEVFEAEYACGCCKGTDLHYQVRTVEENDFFELRCMACDARFSFGQNKKGGGLFPKRRSSDGPLPNGGWAKWERQPAR